jgi:hypothetical protein
LMWGELLRTLLGRRMLRAFLRVVSADRPALASGIAALDIDDSASGDPVDPFEVRLLPPGRRSLIDRADLRTYLRRFIEEPWRSTSCAPHGSGLLRAPVCSSRCSIAPSVPGGIPTPSTCWLPRRPERSAS